MATIKLADELPSSSLTRGAGGSDSAPEPGPNPAENQAPGSSAGADVALASAQLESGQPQDGADFSTLAYPAMEMSMELSSDPVMYLQITQLPSQ